MKLYKLVLLTLVAVGGAVSGIYGMSFHESDKTIWYVCFGWLVYGLSVGYFAGKES